MKPRMLFVVLSLLPLLCFGCTNYRSGQGPLWIKESAHPVGTTSLAFDPEGRRLASGGFNGEIIIWSVPSGERLLLLSNEKETGLSLSGLNIIKGLAWWGNNRLLSASSDGWIYLWDVSAGTYLTSVKTPSAITTMTQSAGPDYVITGHKDGRLRVYGLPDLRFETEYDLQAPILSLARDRAGQQIAVSTKGGQVSLLTSNLSLIKDLEKSPRDALEIRFSPDGGQLGAGGWYKIMFWDLKTGQVRQMDTEHWGAIISIDYSPDGKRLISLGRWTDNNIRLIDLKTGNIERRLLAHELCGYIIRFSPDGRYIASGSDDESVRLYDLNEAYPQ